MPTSTRIFSRVICFTALSACGGPGPYPERLPIGSVQGEVDDNANAVRHRSPLNGETVVVRGVVHQILRWTVRDGRSNWGIMIQDLPTEADGDGKTSDGLFVYAGFSPALPLETQGNYDARVGDVVTLRGKVNERYNQTELSEAKVLAVVKGGDVDKLLPPLELTLSDDPAETARILERVEGMRVRMSPGAVTMTGTHPEERNGDLRLWVVPADHPVLKRENPEERKLFRGGHPLSGLPPDKRVAGHGRKVEIGSLALRGRLSDANLRFPRVRSGSDFRTALVGGIHYSYNSYVLQVEDIGDLRPASSPTLPVASAVAKNLLRVSTYNVENLYDFVNDPFDNCDFQGDPGCRNTRFPLNYVPANDEVFRARLKLIAEQIVRDVGSPDVILIQEVEDQDVGKLEGGGMVYGDVNHADGELDALQELAVQIVAAGGPIYGIAADRSAADERGIICAYLYKTSRFRRLSPEVLPSILGANPSVSPDREWFPETRQAANPKAFNARYTGDPDSDSALPGVFSRAVQILGLEDLQSGRRLWVFNNHFNSGPNRMAERRTQQAAVNAELAQAILKVYPDDVLLTGGDLNVFPRPDDPHNPPSDQLAPLYNSGLFNAVDYIFEHKPANAASYIFRGELNILDHLFLSPAAKKRLRFAYFLPINAGSPEDLSRHPPIRASDHDPLVVELDWN